MVSAAATPPGKRWSFCNGTPEVKIPSTEQNIKFIKVYLQVPHILMTAMGEQDVTDILTILPFKKV